MWEYIYHPIRRNYIYILYIWENKAKNWQHKEGSKQKQNITKGKKKNIYTLVSV